jgi:hypothetical protein
MRKKPNSISKESILAHLVNPAFEVCAYFVSSSDGNKNEIMYFNADELGNDVQFSVA